MDITERHLGGMIVVELGGETDLYNSPDLKTHLNGLVDGQHYRIVLNLKRVTYMDSTAIGVLLHILNVLREHHGELVLAEVPTSLVKVLQLTKVLALFKLYDSEAVAVAALANK